MRNLKKFLALVMAMVMAMSLMVTANAAVTTNKSYPDSATADPAFDEAITVLSGMGVFSGDNGNFYPTRNVTRAEAAALVYRLATGDVSDTQAYLYAKYGNFPDVNENAWYAGYVGYCANKGLIKGRTDGTFDPSGSVTGYEILAMILRAVGYDQNGEFTGADWQVNVSALAQKLGVIANVNSTQYGGTLYLPAERQVVADLLFQTDAYVPQVNYTTAFGYQYYGNEGGIAGSKVNETLGEKIFGLSWNNGVVVGNEVTGEAEGITKIGFSLDGTGAIDNTMQIRHKYFVDAFSQTVTDYYGSAYVYASDVMRATDVDGNPTFTYTPEGGGATVTVPQQATTNWAGALNVTRAFKWDSDLTLFDHAVKVWYDNRSSQYEACGWSGNVAQQLRFTTNLNTYAVFDELKHDDHDGSRALIETTTAVVAVQDDTANKVGLSGTRDAEENLYLAATNDYSANVTNNWVAPSMTVNKSAFYSVNGTTLTPSKWAAYFNYGFGATAYNNYGENTTDANSATSPVLKNNANATDDGAVLEWPLYLLIANGSDKSLDMVITLDMTMTKITQANNTTSPRSVGVYNGNISPVSAAASAQDYFDTWDQVVAANYDEYAVIAQDNLVNTPNRALGTNVAAIQVTGTTGPNATYRSGAVGSYNWGYADPIMDDVPTGDSTEISTYYYQLTENKIFKTETVIYINPRNQDLTLSDGSTLHQSVFAEDVDATFTTNMEGVHVKADGSYSKQLEEGRKYTFTLDEQGNYIYWTTPRDTGSFVYGTYIDFYSKLASSSFDYPLVYVSANGEAKQQDNITKATVWDGTAWVQAEMGNVTYDQLQLPKRDSSSATAAATSGYEMGNYIGYALVGSELKAITPTQDWNTGFFQATENDFGAKAYTIDETAEKLGALTVSDGTSNIEFFLTNNTQFYVVDGAGTDNQTVTPYKGLAGLRAGYKDVVINVSDTGSKLLSDGKYLLAATDPAVAGTTVAPWDMVYFDWGRQDYAQDYLGSAVEVRTVFLPKDALTFNAKIDNALHFVGSRTVQNISVIEGEKITQFTMYDSEGTKKSVWVDGYIDDDNNTAARSSAWVIDSNGNNVFYNLIDSGKKAIDGQPIYNVRPLTAKEAESVIGKYYGDTGGYTAATKTYTAGTDVSVGGTYTGATAPAIYKATTANAQVAYIDESSTFGSPISAKLYNVNGANIVNLNRFTYPGITTGNTAADLASLNDAGSLTSNTGVQVSCVCNGVTVSVVFVNA